MTDDALIKDLEDLRSLVPCKSIGDLVITETIARLQALEEALTKIDAALRKDVRDKTIMSDAVEYHLDGQTMYHAINLARAALAGSVPKAEPTCKESLQVEKPKAAPVNASAAVYAAFHVERMGYKPGWAANKPKANEPSCASLGISFEMLREQPSVLDVSFADKISIEISNREDEPELLVVKLIQPKADEPGRAGRLADAPLFTRQELVDWLGEEWGGDPETGQTIKMLTADTAKIAELEAENARLEADRAGPAWDELLAMRGEIASLKAVNATLRQSAEREALEKAAAFCGQYIECISGHWFARHIRALITDVAEPARD